MNRKDILLEQKKQEQKEQEQKEQEQKEQEHKEKEDKEQEDKEQEDMEQEDMEQERNARISELKQYRDKHLKLNTELKTSRIEIKNLNHRLECSNIKIENLKKDIEINRKEIEKFKEKNLLLSEERNSLTNIINENKILSESCILRKDAKILLNRLFQQYSSNVKIIKKINNDGIDFYKSKNSEIYINEKYSISNCDFKKNNH